MEGAAEVEASGRVGQVGEEEVGRQGVFGVDAQTGEFEGV